MMFIWTISVNYVITFQLELGLKDLGFLFPKRYGTALPQLVVNIYGPVCNHSQLFADGVILNRLIFPVLMVIFSFMFVKLLVVSYLYIWFILFYDLEIIGTPILAFVTAHRGII